MDGTSIWAGDRVHLTSNASRVSARKLMADLAKGCEDAEPAAKRTRLESVIPVPAPAKKKEAAKGQLTPKPPGPIHRRRSGYPASCRRPSVGGVLATRTPHTGGEALPGTALAAEIAGPTAATEGR